MKRVDKRVAAVGWWVLGWFGVPILAFGAVWFGAQDLGPAWRAAHGVGLHGALLVQEIGCNRTGSVYGEFTADDGTVRIHHALLDEPPRGLSEGGSS